MDIKSVYLQGANIFEMLKYLIFACFLMGVTCRAQVQNFSLHAGLHLPVIPSVDNVAETFAYSIPSTSAFFSTTLTGHIKEFFTDKSGYALRGQFDYPISSKFYLTSGLSVSYIRFRRQVHVLRVEHSFRLPDETPSPTLPVVGRPFGTISIRDADGNAIESPSFEQSKNIGKTTALSVHVPVLVGTSFLKEKLQVRAGAVFSYLLHATEVKQQYTLNRKLSEYKDTSKAGFNTFQAGIALHSTYLVFQRIGIDLGAQKNLTPIYSNSQQQAGKARYNFLSLGLCYNFL